MAKGQQAGRKLVALRKKVEGTCRILPSHIIPTLVAEIDEHAAGSA